MAFLAMVPLPVEGRVLRAGGFCLGRVWVTLSKGERATWLQGTDGASVSVNDDRGLAWSAGSYGNGVAIAPGYRELGPIVAHRPGYTVRRMTAVDPDGRHPVYLLIPTRRLSPTEEIGMFDNDAVEFLSPRFAGGKRDLSFLPHVTTGPVADARCAAFWKTMR